MMALPVMVVMMSAPLVVEAALRHLAYGQELAGETSDRGTWNLGYVRGRPPAGNDAHCAGRAAWSMAVSFEVAGLSTRNQTKLY